MTAEGLAPRIRAQVHRERPAQAYILAGEDSVLREAGRAAAAQLLCEGRGSCGSCPSCVALARDAHPDYRQVQPDGLTMKIAGIRNVRGGALVSGLWSGSVVFALFQADRLSPEAANALLKILEEPPAGVVFLLLTSRPGNLLPTILSRCQMIRLPRTGLLGGEEGAETAAALGALLERADVSRYADAAPSFARWRYRRGDLLTALEALEGVWRDGWRQGRVSPDLLALLEDAKGWLEKDADVPLVLDALYVRAAALRARPGVPA